MLLVFAAGVLVGVVVTVVVIAGVLGLWLEQAPRADRDGPEPPAV